MDSSPTPDTGPQLGLSAFSGAVKPDEPTHRQVAFKTVSTSILIRFEHVIKRQHKDATRPALPLAHVGLGL